MRRSSSEVIRSLERRIARLENRSAHYPDGFDAYDTSEMERPLDIFESRRRDDERYQDAVSRAEVADKQIKSTLKGSRIKYTMHYGRYKFADKRTLVKALEALGVDRRQARILGESGTDPQSFGIKLFGKSYDVGVPDLEDEQYDYYLEASF